MHEAIVNPVSVQDHLTAFLGAKYRKDSGGHPHGEITFGLPVSDDGNASIQLDWLRVMYSNQEIVSIQYNLPVQRTVVDNQLKNIGQSYHLQYDARSNQYKGLLRTQLVTNEYDTLLSCTNSSEVANVDDDLFKSMLAVIWRKLPQHTSSNWWGRVVADRLQVEDNANIANSDFRRRTLALGIIGLGRRV